ncbi:MAG: phosphatase PAP2 family protein [Pseudomonadota bacterium]
MVCYPAAAFHASQAPRPSVATAWDAHIPWLPWTILPYLATTLLLIASFWLVPHVQALRLLSQRLLLATVSACLVFVSWPLQFSTPRMTAESPVWSALFDTLRLLDSPYNQLPSLHVAYAVILWAALRDHWRHPLWPIGLAVGLLGMSLSTLLTHQHHLLDVVAGAAWGAACVWAVRPGPREPRVAFYYLMAAGAWWVVSLAWVHVGWALYGSLSLLLVARAYAQGDAGFLHKRQGRHPWWSWVLHAPYLAGYRLTWWAVQWRERHQPACRHLGAGLWVGRRLSARQVHLLPPGCTVIDLANELSETPALRRQPYHAFAMLDLVPPPPELVQQVVALLDQELRAGHPVYLHCAMGYARSLQLAAAHAAAHPGPDHNSSTSFESRPSTAP